MRNPLQPIAKDSAGTPRFKENKIVSYLLDHGGFDLNDIAKLDFSTDDREQFAQLIGYSLCGFSELSYVTEDTYSAADALAERGVSEIEAKVISLEEKIGEIREALRVAAAAAFRIHPDDLEA